MEAQGWALQADGHPLIRFDYIDLEFEATDRRSRSEIVSGRIAEMLLQGFGTDDIIIFGEQLERYTISDVGEVF